MPKFTNFQDIVKLAKSWNFTITSTTNGRHNVNSKHFRGLAVDVRTRGKTDKEIDGFITICRFNKLRVIDERMKPSKNKIWSGPHLHIEII